MRDRFRQAFRISIHALREEGDSPLQGVLRETKEISIHALREEGDCRYIFHAGGQAGISIHALREEGDPCDGVYYHAEGTFLSTPSARRATCQR